MQNKRVDVGRFKGLEKFFSSACDFMPNGGAAIGRDPEHSAWYLFHLYPALLTSEIDALERDLDFNASENFREFYSSFNGLTLFGAGQFCLWGLRKQARSDMPNYQPIDLVNVNRIKVQTVAFFKPGMVFIGEYFGKYMFYSFEGAVYCCLNDDATPLRMWRNIFDLVEYFIEAMSPFYDKECNVLDSSVDENPVALIGKIAE